ncbi:amidase signature domain-containing protein [Xylaria sp. FL0043]|nr:amidase signature domain-containing protein [Xylaria sp. FL0043]
MAERNKTPDELRELLDASSDILLEGLNSKQFTSLDLVKAFIRNIDAVNAQFRAVLEINPDAYSIAIQSDYERTHGILRGPLHGLPVLIKGNIGTKDRVQTTAGSYALLNTVIVEDSTVVTKLRDQGLIILGKTSLTEWSMFRSNNWPHAWNPISGQTYGAYYPKQCPGGSSGGSAVACDLGLAWATVGTETDGSIVIPSERNNIVGIKPTVGLTSRYLVVPVSEHQDTVGPMARTVKDAARLLQVLSGPDVRDKYTLLSPFGPNLPDYVAACRFNGLRGKRIGIPRNVIRASTDMVSHSICAFENAISLMAESGATMVEDADFTAYEQLRERKYNPVTRADFARNLPEYMRQLEHNPHMIESVRDLRDFTRNCPEEEYPLRNTSVWDCIIDTAIDNTSPEFVSMYAENMRLGGEGGILGALERFQLDAIVLPTALAPFAPALVGTPIITVPLGVASAEAKVTKEAFGDAIETAPGLPIGISFLGRRWSEELLIEIAYAFEQRTLY